MSGSEDDEDSVLMDIPTAAVAVVPFFFVNIAFAAVSGDKVSSGEGTSEEATEERESCHGFVSCDAAW